MSYEITAEQSTALHRLADGKACSAGVSAILHRIARGRELTSHEVYYCTGSPGDQRNFYARLRAAGLCTAAWVPLRRDLPSQILELEPVRPDVQLAAAHLVNVLDLSARITAKAEHSYAQALGWDR